MIRYHLVELYTAIQRELDRREDPAMANRMEVIWKLMNTAERHLTEKALFRLVAA
jgi:hypothetical protein